MNTRLTRIDTPELIFGQTAYSQISLGRLYIHYFHRLFSSRVINNLDVEIDVFLKALVVKTGMVEILAEFHTTNHKTSENNPLHELDPQYFYENYREIFILLEKEAIIIGLKNDSFKILHTSKSQKLVNSIVEIYESLGQNNNRQ